MTTQTTSEVTAAKPVTRRRRNVRKLIVFLLVFAALLVAADYGIAAAAEYQVSKRMRAQLNLNDDPSVKISGFPFVLQALEGDYRRVDIAAYGISVGQGLRNVQVNVTLYDAKVPLDTVLSGSVHSVAIDRVEGQVRVSAADMNTALNQTEFGKFLNISNLTIDPATPDTPNPAAAANQNGNQAGANQDGKATPADDGTSAGLKLSFNMNLGGNQIKVSVTGTLMLVGSQIQVQPTKVEVGDGLATTKLPDDLQRMLMSALSTKLDPSAALPIKVAATGVSVEANTLVLKGRAFNVVFENGKMSNSK